MLGDVENSNVSNVYSSKKNNVKNVSRGKDQKARYLVEKFQRSGCTDADGCYYFFVKCFGKLSEDTVWSIYENATNNPKVKSPIKYFIAACRNQMA